MTEDTGIGGAIGTMIGLGIGIGIAKKLTDVVKEETKEGKKSKPKNKSYGEVEMLPHNKKLIAGKHGKIKWVEKETGVWS